ncbi:MAG: LrgB family protein [Gammaproteobacteria bacterium]
MSGELYDLWVYLSAEPLLHLTLTLVAFQIGLWLFERFNNLPLLNPVLIAIVLIAALLTLTDTPYSEYFEGAQFVHFLLGPATVALALPLYKHFDAIRRSAPALLVSIISGSVAAIVSAVGLAWLLDASEQTLISMAPKSVTSPVAMGITEQLGGIPSLTAVFVILTGIIGAMFGPALLDLIGVRDWRARGLAMGVASHGIGTARAIMLNPVAGAFAGLAMGLNALATAILLPLLWHWIF